jgi:hypothetical protein
MSKRLRFAPIAAATVLTALLAAGCGSSNSSGQPHKTSALVATADPVCQKVAVKREAANAALHEVSSSTTKTLQVLAKVAPGIASVENSAVATLSKLKPTTAEETEWDAILLGMRLLAEDTTKLAAAAKADNINEVHRIDTAGKQLQEKLAVIAKRNGFAYCGVTS